MSLDLNRQNKVMSNYEEKDMKLRSSHVYSVIMIQRRENYLVPLWPHRRIHMAHDTVHLPLAVFEIEPLLVGAEFVLGQQG